MENRIESNSINETSIVKYETRINSLCDGTNHENVRMELRINSSANEWSVSFDLAGCRIDFRLQNSQVSRIRKPKMFNIYVKKRLVVL